MQQDLPPVCIISRENPDANDESSGGGLLTSCWSCFKEHVSRSNSLLEWNFWTTTTKWGGSSRFRQQQQQLWRPISHYFVMSCNRLHIGAFSHAWGPLLVVVQCAYIFVIDDSCFITARNTTSKAFFQRVLCIAKEALLLPHEITNHFFQHGEIWEAASGNEKGREKVAEFCFWFLADVLL